MPAPAVPPERALARPGGAFVTLHAAGVLRGCLGHVAANEPLGVVVARMAAAAAREDPRFAPVAPDELPTLRIEVSVLEGPVRLQPAEPAAVRIGVDGVIVRRGAAVGVLLPQVAAEHGWAAEAFLEAACRKAGLTPRAWQSADVEVYIFEADVFSE
jgi:AmmeMemoRadiSam system protein A